MVRKEVKSCASVKAATKLWRSIVHCGSHLRVLLGVFCPSSKRLVSFESSCSCQKARVYSPLLLFYFAIPIPGVILSYHLFWYVSDDYELTSWSPAVLFLLCLVLCCLGCVGFVLLLLCGFCSFVLRWLDVIARWKLNGLCIDPYSVHLLVHIVASRWPTGSVSVKWYSKLRLPTWETHGWWYPDRVHKILRLLPSYNMR